MKAACLGAFLGATALTAEAHRLDEYLQAARVVIAEKHVELRLELTPGVAVLPELWPLWDGNGDRRLAKSEQRAYAARMLRDLRVQLNGEPVTLAVARVQFSSAAALREGDGVIRITARGAIQPMPAGEHELIIHNDHLPAISVYLVNALVPPDPSIRIVRQDRDETQREYRLRLQVR